MFALRPDPLTELRASFSFRHFSEAEVPIERCVPRDVDKGAQGHGITTHRLSPRLGSVNEGTTYTLPLMGRVNADLLDVSQSVELVDQYEANDIPRPIVVRIHSGHPAPVGIGVPGKDIQ
jgi:hypothetical protein